jgi:sigma-B regulation protein RsbU (phosphoserine phosphatase)
LASDVWSTVMTIRSRLLRYGLLIALLPMLVVVLFHRDMLARLDERIGQVAYQSLTRNARSYLQTVVEDYGRVGALSKRNVESLLRWQAREVEARLAGLEAGDAAPIYFSADYDAGKVPTETTDLQKFMRYGDDGAWSPIPVNFEHQVYVRATAARGPDVQRDMRLLSGMADVYARLYRMNPPLLQWLYTALESGFHSCYPGHGGYPPDYDPRERLWYKRARDEGDLTWTLLPVVSSRSVSLTVSMPVRRPDGSFAGVTAIDVPLASMLRDLKLPQAWADQAEVFHVMPGLEGSGDEGKLLVVVHRSYETRGRDWRSALELNVLTTSDSEGLAELIGDARAKRSGVRRMDYQGVDSLWAWSPYDDDRLVSVVIVPYAGVVADARGVRGIIGKFTSRALLYSALVFLGALVLVTLLAIRRSRGFTEPIRKLSWAAQRLGQGHLETKVEIQTGDELEYLGGMVNTIGPQLAQRDRMQKSLLIARDVQLHLLPHGPPALEGYDLAGASLSCDETGGDYYDYILVPGREGRLGIAIADITGHGVGAALLMASTRAVLRAHAMHDPDDLGRMFADLNNHLVHDTGDARFVTMFYGLLEGPAGKLTWCSAGHDPALLHRHSCDGVESLSEGNGLLLGAFEDVSYTQAGPIELQSGDVLLIGTDGIWEAQDPDGKQFGKSRLEAFLSKNANLSADRIVQALQEEITRFRGPAPQEDDITVVVVKKL